MARLLAIDYGTKRTGLAVTDPLQIIATALDTVPTAQLISFLQNYIQKEAVEVIVVGKPTQTDGSPSATLPAVIGLVRTLKKTFPTLLIDEEDERYTTVMAQRSLIESGKSKNQRKDKGLIDQVSAVIILQSYMQRQSYQKGKI
jgi:putative Holliday junction resolvase